jgi:hypothetical protein
MSNTRGLKALREELEAHKIAVEGKDGRFYTLRPIRLSDAPSLMRGYDAMSDTSKWFRVLHSLPHLTESTARVFCSPDPNRELCIVVEGIGERGYQTRLPPPKSTTSAAQAPQLKAQAPQVKQ